MSRHGQTVVQTDRQTHREMEKQMERWTDVQVDGHTERWTDGVQEEGQNAIYI